MAQFPDQQIEFIDHSFHKIAHENQIIADKEFIQCTFKACSFRETQFQNCKFQDCLFKDCDLSLIKVNGSTFTTTSFENSQMIGVNWTLALWSKFNISASLNFENCVLNYATFIGLTLKEIKLSNCIAKDVDFSEANLTSANCTDTDFSNSRFANTNLSKADFTGATNYTIDVTANTVTKAKFTLPEAMSLLHSLDIVLVD
jgi:uncharacterized protein YjbI with pentapeptide repeats